MIAKVFWESFSIGLLLYGSYLIYVYIWFSINKIFKIDIFQSKLIAGAIVGLILLYSFFKWLKKKIAEMKGKNKESLNEKEV